MHCQRKTLMWLTSSNSSSETLNQINFRFRNFWSNFEICPFDVAIHSQNSPLCQSYYNRQFETMILIIFLANLAHDQKNAPKISFSRLALLHRLSRIKQLLRTSRISAYQACKLFLPVPPIAAVFENKSWLKSFKRNINHVILNLA